MGIKSDLSLRRKIISGQDVYEITRGLYANEKVTALLLCIEGKTPQDALAIFEEITSRCDFFSVFHKVDYEENLPEIVWSQLLEIK